MATREKKDMTTFGVLEDVLNDIQEARRRLGKVPGPGIVGYAILCCKEADLNLAVAVQREVREAEKKEREKG